MVKFASYKYKVLLISTKEKKSLRSNVLICVYRLTTYRMKGSNCLKTHTEKKIIGHSVHEKMRITCAAENGVGI